ncbi:MAG: hypothetical protein HY700_13255 [Gemmatimonadetes bacterium]|nr:hypothetical protein [Gemmatimonadota bacterium]
MRLALAAATALAAAALPVHAQSAPNQSAGLTGRYAFEAPLPDGGIIPGEIEIASVSPPAGTVRWASPNGPDSATITQLTADGSSALVVSDNPAGRYTIHLAFVADTFSGTYDGPQSGTLHGRRVVVDPIGVYDFEAGPSGGNKVGGRLVIKVGPAGYSGTVAPDGNEPAPITKVTTEGINVLVLASIGDGGTVTLRLKAVADSLNGTYEVSNGEGGELRSVRIRR